MVLVPNELNPVKLADWLELVALESADKNASANDLARELDRIEKDDNDEIVRRTISEIDRRCSAACDAYPFELIDNRVLQARPNWDRDYGAYIFCLCLSFFKWKSKKNAPINPWYLFEDLCLIAARQYIQGPTLKFGSRGMSKLADFRSAINELSLQLGEGAGFKGKKTFRKKDAKVDIVAWRDMPDKLPGKLILFGQCAGGEHWEEKTSEMQPDKFWANWMMDSQISALVRTFYMPHRINCEELDYWTITVRDAGILFDRCRVAYWAFQDNAQVVADLRYYDWCSSIFPSLARH